LLLSLVAILILGPLGGVAAAYMNFSLGFFVGGQVLAGILGSAVTYGYGPEGKHGANYMQTMAASVAGMAGMGVLIQAMTWLGMEAPPMWQLALFFMCIGMFGVGLGMAYTPILVDRLKLDLRLRTSCGPSRTNACSSAPSGNSAEVLAQVLVSRTSRKNSPLSPRRRFLLRPLVQA
jgi:hypothetical protein